jgi:hypothetical protein
MSVDSRKRHDDESLGWVASQCASCRHRSSGPIQACAAFPASIPDVFLSNAADHRKPWINPETGGPGDTGVSGDRSITFEPRDDVDPAYLQRLYHQLDKIHEE